MFGRNKLATLVAEFLGTGFLTLVILSVQRSSLGVPFFWALAAGLAVAVLMVSLSRVTEAHFNPAVTVGMWTIRRVSTLRAIVLIVMQLLGAWVAFFLYRYMVNQTLQPVGGDFSSRILVAEAVAGVVLGLAWAAVSYEVFSRNARAALISTTYVLAIVLASAAAIGLVNPAVALGVRAWEWGTYVLGPVLGVVIGANLYALLFAPRVAVRAGSVVRTKETAPAEARTKRATTKSRTTKSTRSTKKR
jgi:glycerol uptake facilitator-like aquaporin